VQRGESARELWERALAPMGLDLLARVVRHARDHGELPAKPQDARFATRAPMVRRAVVLDEDAPPTTTSLVVTVVGPDRPGIVRLLSERAQRFGANWAASRLSRLAGEFAGMVHFEVPRENADALAASLQGLESSGLKLVISKSDPSGAPPGMRGIDLSLVGDDRVGIVSQLTRILAEAGISIEHLHSEVLGATATAPKTFKVSAHLLVPDAVGTDELRQRLEPVASEMKVDIALGDRTD
jgi:glycine cleavage system regulatory protein